MVNVIGRIRSAWANQEHERLGQFFVNRYIKGHWPELFYTPDNDKAETLINQWLKDHQYEESMPPKVRDLP